MLGMKPKDIDLAVWASLGHTLGLDATETDSDAK